MVSPSPWWIGPLIVRVALTPPLHQLERIYKSCELCEQKVHGFFTESSQPVHSFIHNFPVIITIHRGNAPEHEAETHGPLINYI
jgi:hypothetical protein